MSEPYRLSVAGLWGYVAERVAIRDRRARGLPPPWTDDPVLQRNHFPNVHREDDTGTRWFHARRAERGWDDDETLWASLTYRPINRVDTFVRHDGPPTLGDDADLDRWLAALDADLAAGVAVSTARHYVRGTDAYRVVLADARRRWPCLSADVLDAPDTETATRALTRVSGIGPFFAWQIACDLLEAGALPFDHDDWAGFGPGAQVALHLIRTEGDVGEYTWGRTPGTRRLETELRPFADRLVATQRAYLPAWVEPRVTLKNLEHALCEYLRYARARGGYRLKNGERTWT